MKETICKGCGSNRVKPDNIRTNKQTGNIEYDIVCVNCLKPITVETPNMGITRIKIK